MTDIAAVTRTLKKLIKEELELTLSFAVDTTAAPIEFPPTGTNLISVYLYHVLENPELKNAPPLVRGGPVPVQQAPMGLILQYMVTAVHRPSSGGNPDTDTQREQLLTGLVARAIHDYPIITKNTVIVNEAEVEVPILDPELALQNNTIEFIVRPARTEETVNFWSGEQNALPRLSLFVEARVVVLEPKQVQIFPGIVLSVGTFVFPSASAQLVSSSNVLWFEIPASAGGGVQKVNLTPAQVALHPDDTSALSAIDPLLLENNRLILTGTGLSPARRFLMLKRNATELKIALDAPDVDNPAWQFSVLPSKIECSVRRDVSAFVNGALVATATTIDPGSYTARILIEDDRFGGKPRSSNILAFSIIPQIVSVDPIGGGTYELVIASDYLVAGGDIQLAIGGNALEETGGTLAAGEFEVMPDGFTIQFILDTGATPPSASKPLPVRLVVNGATATPVWLTQESV